MLELVELSDTAGAARWHAIEARCMPVDLPGVPAVALLEVEQLIVGPHGSERPVLFVATDGDADVANATVWLSLRDNLDMGTVIFAVDPARRRRGLGTAMARALIEWLRAQGRTRALFMAPAPLDGPASSEPLARGFGAELANEVVRNELDVAALDVAALDALHAARVAHHADGYELVTWVDRVPDELVDGAAYLIQRMSTDTPMGTIEWEPEVWDAARYREREDEAEARYRRRVAAGAVERSSGRLVAYTDIGVSIPEPAYAEQWDTIVDPDHRGHRLGLLVKIGNLHHLLRVEPRVTRIGTYNAASNAHMVGINEELGFRPEGRSLHWQLSL